MKKVAERCVQYSINGKAWEDCSFWRNTVYVDESELGINWATSPMDFNETVDFISTGKFQNAEVQRTLFRKRPVIVLPANSDIERFRFTEKHNITVEVRMVTCEDTEMSISCLSRTLNAEDFCEFLRDRGIEKF